MFSCKIQAYSPVACGSAFAFIKESGKRQKAVKIHVIVRVSSFFISVFVKYAVIISNKL